MGTSMSIFGDAIVIAVSGFPSACDFLGVTGGFPLDEPAPATMIGTELLSCSDGFGISDAAFDDAAMSADDMLIHTMQNDKNQYAKWDKF